MTVLQLWTDWTGRFVHGLAAFVNIQCRIGRRRGKPSCQVGIVGRFIGSKGEENLFVGITEGCKIIPDSSCCCCCSGGGRHGIGRRNGDE